MLTLNVAAGKYTIRQAGRIETLLAIGLLPGSAPLRPGGCGRCDNLQLSDASPVTLRTGPGGGSLTHGANMVARYLLNGWAADDRTSLLAKRVMWRHVRRTVPTSNRRLATLQQRRGALGWRPDVETLAPFWVKR